MSKVKPDYWGNIIYETAMGLYWDETEAKEESWMQENSFPLYTQKTVDHLEGRIFELEENLRATTFVQNAPIDLKKASDQELKDILAQRLFDKIKHGDEVHQEWLEKELEDFFKANITR